MAIRTNSYLKIKVDPETGEKRLFGKCGYQTMHKDAGKFTLLNLAAIERAMLAGKLRDINGDIAKDGAIVETYTLVNLVTSDADVEEVGELRTFGGESVEVPDAPAPVAGATANPFGS
jgi:hypothetical protein